MGCRPKNYLGRAHFRTRPRGGVCHTARFIPSKVREITGVSRYVLCKFSGDGGSVASCLASTPRTVCLLDSHSLFRFLARTYVSERTLTGWASFPGLLPLEAVVSSLVRLSPFVCVSRVCWSRAISCLERPVCVVDCFLFSSDVVCPR